MEIFYWEKTYHAGKKIRKNDFAPSEKYACYAPVQNKGVLGALNLPDVLRMWNFQFFVSPPYNIRNILKE